MGIKMKYLLIILLFLSTAFANYSNLYGLNLPADVDSILSEDAIGGEAIKADHLNKKLNDPV